MEPIEPLSMCMNLRQLTSSEVQNVLAKDTIPVKLCPSHDVSLNYTIHPSSYLAPLAWGKISTLLSHGAVSLRPAVHQ